MELKLQEVRDARLKEIQISDLAINRNGINWNIVEELKMSINQVGLLNPIVINSAGKLVAGRHRAIAIEQLGHKSILAREVKFGKKGKRELATIQENLARNTYRRFERARMVGTQEELLKELGLVSSHGGNRKIKMRKSQLESVSKKIGKMTGQSERTVGEDLQIAKGIPRKLDSMILSSSISDSRDALLKIATAKEDKKESVAKDLIAKTSGQRDRKDGGKPKPLSPYDLLQKTKLLFDKIISNIQEYQKSTGKKESHQILELLKEIVDRSGDANDQILEIKEKLKD